MHCPSKRKERIKIMKKMVVLLILAMTVLVGCNEPEQQTNVSPITKTLKNVTDEVSEDISEIEDNVGFKTGFRRVTSEDGISVDVFFEGRDEMVVTEVKMVGSEETLPIKEYNDQWVLFEMNGKTFLADIVTEHNYELVENQVVKTGYSLLEVPEDTELPQVED